MQLFDISRYKSDGPCDVIIIELMDRYGNGYEPTQSITVPLNDLPRLIWRLYQSLDKGQIHESDNFLSAYTENYSGILYAILEHPPVSLTHSGHLIQPGAD